MMIKSILKQMAMLLKMILRTKNTLQHNANDDEYDNVHNEDYDWNEDNYHEGDCVYWEIIDDTAYSDVDVQGTELGEDRKRNDGTAREEEKRSWCLSKWLHIFVSVVLSYGIKVIV